MLLFEPKDSSCTVAAANIIGQRDFALGTWDFAAMFPCILVNVVYSSPFVPNLASLKPTAKHSRQWSSRKIDNRWGDP